MHTRVRPSSRLTTGLVLLGFLVAIFSGAIHPLGLVADHAVVCHDHADGHLDPPAPDEHHDHTCAFCRLAHSLSRTTPPGPAQAWLLAEGSVVARAGRATTRPARTLPRTRPPRAPPCV